MDFTKFNIDDNPITPGKYGIKAIPTIAIFKDGRPMEWILKQWGSTLPETQLIETANAAIRDSFGFTRTSGSSESMTRA